jgi:hypothetical protein
VGAIVLGDLLGQSKVSNNDMTITVLHEHTHTYALEVEEG